MQKQFTFILSMLALFIWSPNWVSAQDIWQQSTPTGDIPAAREGHSLVTIGDKVYMFGGRDGNKTTKSILNSLTVYNAENLEWEEEDVNTPSPPPRSNHKAIVKNNKMYIFLGSGTDAPLADVWEYNPISKEWTQLVSPSEQQPEARYDHSAMLVGNSVFILGGQNSAGNALADLWAYNFTNNQWEHYPDLPSGGIYGHSAFAQGDEFYFFGGFINDNLDNAIYKYNLGNNSWSIISPQGEFPNPFAYAASSLNNGQAFLFGGLTNSGSTGNCYQWDLATHQFTQLASGPELVNAAAVNCPTGSYDKRVNTDFQEFLLFGGAYDGLLYGNTWVYTSTIELLTNIAQADQFEIQLYPNPANDFISIEINQNDLSTKNIHYQLCDINGTILKSEAIVSSKTQLNIEHQASAVFFVRILDDEKILKTYKRIKQ